MRTHSIPLAWSLLIHDKVRFVWSIAGVSFAVLLMFVEMGFLNGVFDSETLIIKAFNADILMVSRLKDDCYTRQPFPRSRIRQAMALGGVEAVYPMYLDWLPLKVMANSKIQMVTLFAYNTLDPVLLIPELNQYGAALKRPWTMLMDDTARQYCYGEVKAGMKMELRGRGLDVVGTFPLFANYSTDGHVIMDDSNLLALWPDEKERLGRMNAVDFGLIRLKPGFEPDAAIAALRAALPSDVSFLTKQEMVQRVEAMWRRNQPVVEVFGLGMFIGFVIGIIICYQILFTGIEDLRAEFATIKAMGYTNRYLVKVVLQKGFYLALLSFVPGLTASVLVYSLLQSITGIMMRFTPVRIGSVFLLTLGMCMISAILAVRKVLKSDPAEVF
jgi:putative ABC transport system permease protein